MFCKLSMGLSILHNVLLHPFCILNITFPSIGDTDESSPGQVLSVPSSNLGCFVSSSWSHCICWHWKGLLLLSRWLRSSRWCILLFKIFTVVPCIEETILFQHIEEILGYLQVCEKLEATKTFLCVQQVYNHVVNHLTQLPGSLFSWATYMYYNFLG